MAPVAMMNMDLEGQGEELLTVVRNYATPQEWGAWLRVPLSGAAAEGNIGLVDSLVAAGADAGPGPREVSIHSFIDAHTNECVSRSIVIHAHSFVCLFFFFFLFSLPGFAENAGCSCSAMDRTISLQFLVLRGTSST